MPDLLDRLKTALANRYTIEEELGAGGMATVYLAHDLKHDRKVAVKVLRPELAAVIGGERFLVEIKTTANLQHPHILPLFDSGEADGFLYYVMPFIDGESLREKLNKETQLGIDEAVGIAKDVADALDYAHRHDVIHRDIKPENILLQDGRPVVADFGIALAVTEAGGERLTETGLSLGTPAYMSPEQAIGDRELDARSDIYSLACVLYEMLAGDPPFAGSNVQAVIAKVINEKPTGLRFLRGTVPEHVEVAIEKALAKVPADRFGTAGEFSDAVAAQPAAVHERAATPLWRTTTAKIAGAILLAAVVGWWMLFGSGGGQLEQFEGSIRPLTGFGGASWASSWSPGGSAITYTHVRESSADLFVLYPAGGDPFRLTDHRADELNPRWSPDGGKIAFLSDRGSGTDIYWISPTGGPETKLAETNIPFMEQVWPWLFSLGAQPWSPDGGELLFSRSHPGGEVAIWKINLATGEETQLTHPEPGVEDLAASWSFDGDGIVFARGRGGQSGLWWQPTGGQAELLIAEESPAISPVWTTDGRRVVFSSTRGGPFNLWEIDVRSRQMRQITTSPGFDFMASIGRDGRLAYTQFAHQTDLYWMDVDAPRRDHERLTSFTLDNFGAKVSPDGNAIVYHSNHRRGDYEIWMLERETGVNRPLTDNPATDVMPDWSPDGSEVAFVSDREGSFQLWLLDVGQPAVRRLTDQDIQVKGPTVHANTMRWSPDGDAIGYIAATSEGMALWLVSPEGGDARPTGLRGVLSFDWYRDGSHVVYTRKAAGGAGVDLVGADLETDREVVLLTGSIAELTAARDGSAVAFLLSESHYDMDLHRLRLEAGPGGLPRAIGEPEQITFGDGAWHVHHGDWSPDGRFIVYTRDTDRGDIYLVENYR